MNFISIANKIGNRARKSAIKQAEEEAYILYEKVEREKVQEFINKRTEELYQIQFDKEVKNLDKDLTTAFKTEGLKDVLAKHGFAIKKPDEKLTGKWFWITLRPSPEHRNRFVEFKQQTFKYLERTMFIKWKLAFEQKGETEETMGEGYHVHIIAQCANWCSIKKMVTDTKSTWDKWFNGYVPNAFVEIDKLTTVKEVEIKELYINGHKSDKHKQPAIVIDTLWRKNAGLQPTYCSPAYQDRVAGL